MTIVSWNGADIPEALKDLPPGRYVIQPVEDVIDLDDHEQKGLEHGVRQLDRGETVSHDDAMSRARRHLRR